MRRAAIMALVGVLGLGVFGAVRAAGERRCVGGFAVESLMQRPSGGGGRVANTPIEGRFLTGVPGSSVPVAKDGSVARRPAGQTMTRGPKGEILIDGKPRKDAPADPPAAPDPARWISLGLFRVWDDGTVEELRYHSDTGVRAWISCE